ncbi:helix-turn-helix domain-containing protein [Rhodococcus globerulus]|uniref:AlbA family DNA-binding domain-containing protein n=1 Tax=Rhodococcus globerulus TaxID=33008 RepID=UPI0039E9EBB9
MTPPDPFWSPRTESELQSALTNGLLEETHHLDLKRELAPRASGNKSLAKDLAAFAIDGGMILVGVDEGADSAQPPTLTPQPVEGLSERVEQVALMGVTEPLRVQTTVIPSSEPSKGYLVIRIPPSPRAPHMVDGRYYGRGDKTNVILSNEEVLRYHRLLMHDRSDLRAEARTMLDEINSTSPTLALIAEPLGLRDDLLVGLAAASDWENRVSELLIAAEQDAKGPTYPPYIRRAGFQRRAEGVAVTSGMPNGTRQFEGDGHAAEFVFHESGRLTLMSERTAFLFSLQVQPPRPERKVIFEELIADKAEILVRVTTEVARMAGHQASWRFAIMVRGLKGGASYLLENDFASFSDGSEYTTDIYARETEATLLEIANDPNSVVKELTMPLLRSLGVHNHSKLAWLRAAPPSADKAVSEQT